MVEEHLANRAMLSVCVREVQKDLQDSAKRLLEQKIASFGLGEPDGFKAFRDVISTPGDGLIIFKGMHDYTSESIKSLEGFKRAWIEEAHTLSERSLTMLRPTIRAEGSEIWASWNPRRKADPIDRLLRGEQTPTGAVVVKANWSDNPWFPDVLEKERLDDLRLRPDHYGHIWDGEYAAITEGAYYAKQLAIARKEGRIGHVARDPLMSVKAIWDIGGTGAKSDACTIWIAQFVKRDLWFLDYYEAVGQPLATHVNWLREKGYANAECILPHDGKTHDRVFDVSFESALKEAGFSVTVIPNQGPGAAKMRVESARRLFPRIWFNAASCEGGIEALGAYHERRDAERNIGLGPEHDWASNGADSFGLACVVYEEPGAPMDMSRFKPQRASGGFLAR